ncbi:MAG: riboflavin synthase [Gammaproteobacteria bacterium]|nr:riboflavin synthase [Gammaproteobacteria bacterium]
MFTGIIQAVGKIKNVKVSEKGAYFVFESDVIDLNDAKIGDSIAVNGVCLTAVELTNNTFSADVSQETLDCSIFANFQTGDKVNLEKALRLNQGIDGHLVSGHVDGVGVVSNRYSEGESTRFEITVDEDLVKYIARKGSVCINGVSLTVNNIEGNEFGVNIVPHTFTVTTLGDLHIGTKVNVEIDIIARHLEQLLSPTKNA